ncbi:flagellar basal-body rod protein FlgG [Candidatus Saganbacteria bacterium]|nr:flagellar basal-body rod protein FlgG [Candidatus Saganbacteria bacterium]
MFQPLYVAATGLNAFEDELLNITNNVSNSKTVGFKKSDSQMESLPYVQRSFKDELAWAMQADKSVPSVFPEFGTGVKVAATLKDFSQGTLENTSNPLDIAVQGAGFLQVKMPDGSIGYTRAGNLHADNDGNLVDSNGHLVDPAVILPSGTTGVVIQQNGTMLVSINNSTSLASIGQITLSRFSNPEGLRSMGQNLYSATDSSGDPIVGYPLDPGFGAITQYALESSNVDVISEMMRMVMVQRVFDTITKAVSTYEGMLTALERMKA